MPDLQNPSFEVVGVSEGHADAWTDSQPVGASQEALFNGDALPYEHFEDSWSNNDQAVSEFGVTDLFYATFEGGVLDAETFEYSWVQPQTGGPPFNNLAILEFGTANLTDILFDSGTPEDVEDFEEEWLSNEDYQLTFTDGTDLGFTSFDAAVPESVEDFEEEWMSNEDYQLTFTDGVDLTFANFDAGVPESVEDFEEEWTETYP